MTYALEYAGSSGGTAVGTYQAFVDLGMALGPAITGIIVPHTGYRVIFLCLALSLSGAFKAIDLLLSQLLCASVYSFIVN